MVEPDAVRLALIGNDVDVLVDLGCVLADEGRQADAERCFRRAVELGAEWVAFNLGNTLRELGRPLEAVDAYGAALRAGETDAWLNLGLVLQDLGDLAGADQAYRAAGNAGDAGGDLQLGFLLREQGERREAEQAVARAAEAGHAGAAAVLACWEYDRTLDPGLESRLRAGAELYDGARADLAEVLANSDRLDEARAQLKAGAAQGQSACWLPLGNLLTDRFHDDRAAEAAYRAGIAAGDDYCHTNLGILLAEQGRHDEARAQFLAALDWGDALAAQGLQRLRDDEASG